MNNQPEWTNSETSPFELWKNPSFGLTVQLEIADGAIAFRDKVIQNLRNQIVELEKQNEIG